MYKQKSMNHESEMRLTEEKKKEMKYHVIRKLFTSVTADNNFGINDNKCSFRWQKSHAEKDKLLQMH